MKSTKIIKNILNLLLPYKKRLILAAFSLLTVVGCLLTIGYVIKNFVDTSLDPSSNAIRDLIVLIIIFGIASFLRSYIINSTAEFAANDLRMIAFKNILNSRSEGIDSYEYSDISTRINQDSEYISRVVIDITSFFIRNTMTTIGGIILMFTNSSKLSLIAFSSIGLITILASLLSKKIRNLAKQAENAKSVTSNLVLESIINRKVVSSFCAESKLYNYFLKLNGDSMNKIVTRLRFRSIFFASVITSMLLTISSIVWLGSIEVQHGNMTPGVLASFLFYSFMTALSFGGIMEMISELEKNLANCERIFELMDISPDENYDIIKLEPNSKIELKHISYYFSNQQNSFSLENLNIEFDTGKLNVITGKSGSGKSTIINLIMGIYRPISGEFIIGSKTYDHISPKSWAQKLAYVPQDSLLFNGSILDNISFFDSNPDIDKIESLVKSLDLYEFVSSQKNGLNANIGSLASKISGGQKQRIAIARALYANPDILILDEATSQLDEGTEKLVLEFIKNISSQKTIICVAHRRGAIAMADKLCHI